MNTIRRQTTYIRNINQYIHVETVFKVQNDILQSLDQNNVTIHVRVMLDISAAFDTIDHNTKFRYNV